MNKQEIDKAIEILKDIYPSQKEIKTGEYDHVADALDIAISALEQQLTDAWIPISKETNPKKSDIYLVTFEENGNRYVERFYYSDFAGWMMPVVWQDEGHIDKLLYWCNMLEPCKEVPDAERK